METGEGAEARGLISDRIRTALADAPVGVDALDANLNPGWVADADQALQDGNLTGYSRAVDEARALVERALSTQSQ